MTIEKKKLLKLEGYLINLFEGTKIALIIVVP